MDRAIHMKKYLVFLGLTISTALSAGGTTGGFGVVAEQALKAEAEVFAREYWNAKDIAEGKLPERSFVDSRMTRLAPQKLTIVADHYATAFWATNKMIEASTPSDFTNAKKEQTTAAGKAEQILSNESTATPDVENSGAEVPATN
jgi:hypothetical protein